VAPAALFLQPVRNALTPGLAGRGEPGHVALTSDDGPHPRALCWGHDWSRRATPDSVTATVLRSLTGGDTVLLHDSDVAAAPRSRRATLGALPWLLDHCRAHGLAVGPLAEHGANMISGSAARCSGWRHSQSWMTPA
jgi:peptidoglycan/xylan/chitin deacetylase (PgdA/CDA1 family)